MEKTHTHTLTRRNTHTQNNNKHAQNHSQRVISLYIPTIHRYYFYVDAIFLPSSVDWGEQCRFPGKREGGRERKIDMD